MKTNKGFVSIIALIILIVLAGVGVAYVSFNNKENAPAPQVNTTTDTSGEKTAKYYLEIAKTEAIRWQRDARPVSVLIFRNESPEFQCDPSQDESYLSAWSFSAIFYSISVSKYAHVYVCKETAKIKFNDFPTFNTPPFPISDLFIDSNQAFVIAENVFTNEWNIIDNFHSETASLGVYDSTYTAYSETSGGTEVWFVGTYGYVNGGTEEVSAVVVIDAHSGQILKKISPSPTKNDY